MSSKFRLIWMFLLLISVLVLTACSQTTPSTVIDDQTLEIEEHPEYEEDVHIDKGEDEHAEKSGEEGEEHMDDDHIDPPSDYASLNNPLDGDSDAIEAGRVIFEAQCASCHGADGMGNGPSAAALDPKPANFTDTEMMKDMSDGFMFWRVTEGGMFGPFNSVMPSWKSVLSEDQRWQVITYIRTLGD